MRIVNYFIPRQQSFEEQQAASLLIRSILISILFAVGYFAFSYITGFLIPRYLMVVYNVIFLLQLFAFRLNIFSLRTTSHLFTFFCWSLVVALSLFSGAAYSYVLPWIALIPIMSLVLVSMRAAWYWSFIGLITVVAFVLLKSDDFIPKHLQIPANDWWIASLHIGLQFIMLTLTYIFMQKQKELVTTIEEQNQELRSHERIIEDQHRQLQIKNEGLELEIERRTIELIRNNQQLEQFNYIASHNLRAPIARILGLAQLLETPMDVNSEADIKRRLVQSTRDLDQVVRDLNIILSIRKSNDQTISAVSLQDELNQICSSLEKEIEDSKTHIEINLNEVDTINAIRPYLHSILSNLIANAIKYRRLNGVPHIWIVASREGANIIISIKDNGIGMNIDSIKDKIFTLYSRFHTHVDGRGLGLYLVKTQVEVMGGKIAVSSALNQGTTFTVTLPQA